MMPLRQHNHHNHRKRSQCLVQEKKKVIKPNRLRSRIYTPIIIETTYDSSDCGRCLCGEVVKAQDKRMSVFAEEKRYSI